MEARFQRARRPEQVEARRDAILSTAVAMLRERPVADISLRELSDRVGLAKSNVLRYFDSREAIFLEVLDRSWAGWLNNVEEALRLVGQRRHRGTWARETAVARTIAASLVDDGLLCELISAMAGVLERNISIEFARGFKARAAGNTARLAGLVRAWVPELDRAASEHFAAAVFVIVGGLWPYANPTDTVATVMDELSLPAPREMFVNGLTEGLVNHLIGLVARAQR